MTMTEDLVLSFPGQSVSDVMWVEEKLSLSISGAFEGNVHVQRCMNERSQFPDESSDFSDVDVFTEPKQATTEDLGAFYRIKLSEDFSGEVKAILRTRIVP